MEILYTNNLKELEKELIEQEEILVCFGDKTVYIQYCEEGFDYSIFDSKKIFDEDGEIDFDLVLDGGNIEEDDVDTMLRMILHILKEI